MGEKLSQDCLPWSSKGQGVLLNVELRHTPYETRLAVLCLCWCMGAAPLAAVWALVHQWFRSVKVSVD